MVTKPQKQTVSKLMAQAVSYAGSEKKLGDLTGYSQNAIWDAKRRGSVSGEMAISIDKATSGEVSKHQLRPDLFGLAPEMAAAS